MTNPFTTRELILVTESASQRINHQNTEVTRFEWHIDGVMSSEQDAKLYALMDTKTGKGLLRLYCPGTGWRPAVDGRVQTDLSFECLVADTEEAVRTVREILGIRQEELEKMGNV